LIPCWFSFVLHTIHCIHPLPFRFQHFNFGLLDANSPLVTRIQFYAYEIARNRLGLNEKAHEIAKVEAEKERVKKEKEAKQKEKAAKKARA